MQAPESWFVLDLALILLLHESCLAVKYSLLEFKNFLATLFNNVALQSRTHYWQMCTFNYIASVQLGPAVQLFNSYIQVC